MKKVVCEWSVLVCLILSCSPAYAVPILYDWVFNINGDIYDPLSSDPLPASLDDSGFDWETGLGSITLNHIPAEPGECFLGFFFDHEIDETGDLYWNEYGSISGDMPGYCTWEIDEPGYAYGDIYDHVISGELDNSCGVVPGEEDDVSLAVGWRPTLLAGQSAFITLALSEYIPEAGWYLTQTDIDTGSSIYLTSWLEIHDPGQPAPVAEPASLLLVGTGILFAGAFSRRIGKSDDREM